MTVANSMGGKKHGKRLEAKDLRENPGSKIFGKKVHEKRMIKFKRRGVTKTVERRLNPGRRKGALNSP